MRLLKFYTTWCGPCKVLNTIMQQVDLSGVELIEIDAEADSEKAKQYGVQSVPVLVFEKDGVEVDRIIGLTSPEVIQEKLDK